MNKSLRPWASYASGTILLLLSSNSHQIAATSELLRKTTGSIDQDFEGQMSRPLRLDCPKI